MLTDGYDLHSSESLIARGAGSCTHQLRYGAIDFHPRRANAFANGAHMKAPRFISD
jgi:hypothetical protein